MRSMKAGEIEDGIINGFRKAFKGAASGFIVMECRDDPFPFLTIDLQVYNYFNIRFNYDKGAIGCIINCGDYGIDLKSSEEWFDEADLDKFFQDIKSEIELRIPDKFLKAKGWINE